MTDPVVMNIRHFSPIRPREMYRASQSFSDDRIIMRHSTMPKHDAQTVYIPNTSFLSDGTYWAQPLEDIVHRAAKEALIELRDAHNVLVARREILEVALRKKPCDSILEIATQVKNIKLYPEDRLPSTTELRRRAVDLGLFETTAAKHAYVMTNLNRKAGMVYLKVFCHQPPVVTLGEVKAETKRVREFLAEEPEFLYAQALVIIIDQILRNK